MTARADVAGALPVRYHAVPAGRPPAFHPYDTTERRIPSQTPVRLLVVVKAAGLGKATRMPLLIE